MLIFDKDIFVLKLRLDYIALIHCCCCCCCCYCCVALCSVAAVIILCMMEGVGSYSEVNSILPGAINSCKFVFFSFVIRMSRSEFIFIAKLMKHIFSFGEVVFCCCCCCCCCLIIRDEANCKIINYLLLHH